MYRTMNFNSMVAGVRYGLQAVLCRWSFFHVFNSPLGGSDFIDVTEDRCAQLEARTGCVPFDQMGSISHLALRLVDLIEPQN